MTLRFSKFALAALALVFGSSAFAQEDGDLALTFMVSPIDGHAAQLEQAMAAHTKFRRDNNDPWSWNVYQSVTGEPHYVIRSEGHEWADFDAYRENRFYNSAVQHFMANVSPHVKNLQASIYSYDAENSNWIENDNYRYFSVTTYHLDDLQAFNEAVKTTVDTLKDNDWNYPWGLERLQSGGKFNVVLVIPAENWAGIGEEPSPSIAEVMREAHGDEKAAQNQKKFSDSIRASESYIYRARPDLAIAGR